MKPVLAALLSLAACNAPISGPGAGGASSPADGGSSPILGDDASITQVPGGPTLLSFGSNTSLLDEKSTLIFSAVVSHPDGLSQLAGAVLSDDTGAIQYGAFAVDASKGAYQIRLTWQELHQAQRIQFGLERTRSFSAAFFDNQGRRATATKSVRLHCSAGSACDGQCLTDPIALHDCGMVDIIPSTTRQSCDVTCTGAGMLCGPGFGDGHLGFYFDGVFDSGVLMLTACNQVPPATWMQSSGSVTVPFDRVSCCCYAK